MLELDVKLEGVDELFSKLTATQGDSIRLRALREGGKVLQAAITAGTPEMEVPATKDSNSLPQGALKNDVELHVSRSKHSVSVGYGKYTRHVARWLEYGFHHFKKGKFIVTRVGFFRNAVEQAQEAARGALYDSLLANIQKAFKGQKVADNGVNNEE